MRAPWARALIVKVYGKSVGFHFLQSKLLSLWKPAGRMDCVNLSNGFFLVRLSLKEDFENVLKKGPWFIGGHFLSLRPWEPDFRPSSANVSSVAVWVRLNELPIEYYNAEALHRIGNAIGKVLRVDTFTASESRGRFARLCIQIDVEQPLVTAILLGKAEQPVTYEGIQKLCFGCGRLGHRRETCPYSIRQSSPMKEAEMGVEDKVEEHACNEREQSRTNVEVGPEVVQKDVSKDVQDGTYGSWLVVARKKNGTRTYKSGGALVGQPKAQDFKSNVKHGMDARENNVLGRAENLIGQSRETKRKLSPLRVVERAQILNAIQSISNKPVGRAQLPSSQSASQHVDIKLDNGPNLTHSSVKPTRHSSVKGKRALARLRDPQSQSKGADGNGKVQSSSPVQFRYRPVQVSPKPSGGDLSSRNVLNFRFGESSGAEGAYLFERNSRGESGDVLSSDLSQVNSHHEGLHHHHEECTEILASVDGDRCDGKMEDDEEPVVGSAGDCVDTNREAEAWMGKNATNTKEEESLDQMEFEGNGGDNAAC
nr:uncharacterized protein CFP56_25239 [Quercus suber]